MRVSFLLDENIAAPLADKLAKAGHDVERVVAVSELGEGVDDTAIRRYAVEYDRLIVTRTTILSRCRSTHTVAYSTCPINHSKRTSYITSSSASSRRFLIGAPWRR